MGRYKQAVALTLAVCMSGTAAGCGSSAGSTSGDEEIVIQVLENDTAKQEGYLDELLRAFNEAYADKNIKAVDANLGEYTDLVTNGPDGYGPDVLYQANDQITEFAEQKAVYPIEAEKLDCYDLIAKQAWDAMKVHVDGKEYYCGIPVDVQEPVIFYRADKMPQNWENEWDDDKNGVADFFENWCDLYAFSKQLRDTDTSANKDSQYGLMSSLYKSYENLEFLLSYGAYTFAVTGDGTYDTSDIGLAEKDAAKGLGALRQFAELMDEGCVDDTIIKNRYAKLAAGTYFCAVSTPNTYQLFIDKLQSQYEESEGLSADEALKKAKENLKMAVLPEKFPADGNLSQESSAVTDWVDTVAMGGIGAYAVSAYTQHKDAAMLFIEFATNYDMVEKRQKMLGIIPVRSDFEETLDGTTRDVYENLNSDRIYIMPSVKELNQVWTPLETTLSDVANDPFRVRKGDAAKYDTEEKRQAALESVDQSIYDAIYTLSDGEE